MYMYMDIRKGRLNIVRLAAIDETLNALSSDSSGRSSTLGKGNTQRRMHRDARFYEGDELCSNNGVEPSANIKISPRSWLVQ